MGTLTAGIKEIFSAAKTSGSNVMLCGNDGTPDGHMTMANLASVLGAFRDNISMPENYDINRTDLASGSYLVTSGTQNSPGAASGAYRGVLVQINTFIAYFKMQIIVYTAGRAYFRAMTEEDKTWGNWVLLT